jgi:hypothetical protein
LSQVGSIKERKYKCSWDGKQYDEDAVVTDEEVNYECVATYKKAWGGKAIKTTAYFVQQN